MTLPNFLIIGAAKSGTTSLYHYIKAHPQIYMTPIKETNFFAYEGQEVHVHWEGPSPTAILRSITDIDTYHKQFQGISDEIAIGEASPLYLYCESSPARIKKHIPDVRLISILRNPVERAYSHFIHLRRDGREPCADFGEALKLEQVRMQENWAWDYYYRDMGCYYTQLCRYYERFNPSQIKIFLFEDLNRDITRVLREIFRFLDIDMEFVPNTTHQYHVSGIPKIQVLQDFLGRSNAPKTVLKQFIPVDARRWVRRQLMTRNLEKPELPKKRYQELIEVFRLEILALQDLIERDLSGWLDG